MSFSARGVHPERHEERDRKVCEGLKRFATLCLSENISICSQSRSLFPDWRAGVGPTDLDTDDTNMFSLSVTNIVIDIKSLINVAGHHLLARLFPGQATHTRPVRVCIY